MLRTVILAACFCALACLSSVAEARPSHHFVLTHKLMGLYVTSCADPVMRPCGAQAVAKSAGRLKTRRWSRNRQVVQGARPRAWCGWWMGRHLGIPSRSLWRALAWRHVGRAAYGPAIGVVVVWDHGKGTGHVGIITGRTSKGWVVKSGNDSNAVRERIRSVSNAIAFRWP